MAKKSSTRSGKPTLPPFLMGDDKRTVILRAAHTLFLRDGFSVTSMDAVTQEAGVSKATVYAHFESKEKLFETLIRQGSENAINTAPSLVRRGGDPRQELLAFFEPFLNLLFVSSGGYAWSRLLIAEAHRHPDIAQLFFRCTVERITKSVENYLADLAKDRLFPANELRLAAESFIAMILLGPLHRALLLGPNAVDVQASLRFGIDVLLRSNGSKATGESRRGKSN